MAVIIALQVGAVRNYYYNTTIIMHIIIIPVRTTKTVLRGVPRVVLIAGFQLFDEQTRAILIIIIIVIVALLFTAEQEVFQATMCARI